MLVVVSQEWMVVEIQHCRPFLHSQQLPYQLLQANPAEHRRSDLDALHSILHPRIFKHQPQASCNAHLAAKLTQNLWAVLPSAQDIALRQGNTWQATGTVD